MAACFEFVWLAASWAWGDELPARALWSPLTDTQANRILQGVGHVWLRFGSRFHQFLLREDNAGLRMFRKVGGGPEVRVLVRDVGPNLLLTVHAQHCPMNGIVKFPVCKPCACSFLS